MSVKWYSNSDSWIYSKNLQPHCNCTFLPKGVHLVAICLVKLGWNYFILKRCSFLTAKLTLEAVFISLISVSICWETEVPISPILFWGVPHLNICPSLAFYHSPISAFFKLQFCPLCPLKIRKLWNLIESLCFTRILIAWSWKYEKWEPRAEPRMHRWVETLHPNCFSYKFMYARLL